MTNLDATTHSTQPSSSIKQLYRGVATQDGAGVALTRIIGQGNLPRLDPFLMLDEFGSDEPQD